MANPETLVSVLPGIEAVPLGNGHYALRVEEVGASEVHVFPEVTNETVTLAAHANANAFSGWVEVQDNNAVTLSSKFVTEAGYIMEALMFLYNQATTMYLVEFAYGAAKVIIGRAMVFSDWTYFIPMKSRRIPAGEAIYYRLMCGTAGAKTCRVGFRYFHE